MKDTETITLSISKHILKDLDNYCDKVGQTRSGVLRRCIYEFLQKKYAIDSEYNISTISGM